MRALYINRYGGPEVMAVGEVPDPVVGGEDVLVQVKAASINPVDWKIRSGLLRIVTGSRFPRVLGGDFSGVVQAVGNQVRGLSVGDAVYGSAPVFGKRQGSHAQLLVVPAENARRMPQGLGFEEAASLPIAALTALAGLRPAGPTLQGKEVLVNGATGGVGHFVVQIARSRGARVTAVCSARNADLARQLGAEVVLDYAKGDVTRSGKTFDIVFDAHGGMGFSAASRVLARKGFYANTLPSPSLFLHMGLQCLKRGPRVVGANMRGRPEDYAELEALLASGAVKPVIGERFVLERAREAFAASEGGKARGKIIISME